MLKSILQITLGQSVIQLTQLDPIYIFNHDKWKRCTLSLLINHPHSIEAYQFFNELAQISFDEEKENALIKQYQHSGQFLLHPELTIQDFVTTLSLATQLGAIHTLRYLTDNHWYQTQIKSSEVSETLLEIAINAGQKNAVQFWVNEGASVSKSFLENFMKYMTQYSEVFPLANAIILVHQEATQRHDAQSIALLAKVQLINLTHFLQPNEPDTQVPVQAQEPSLASSATSSTNPYPASAASSSTSTSSSQYNTDELLDAHALIEQAVDKGTDIRQFACFIGETQQQYLNALTQNHKTLYSIYDIHCSPMAYLSPRLNDLLPQMALPSGVTYKNLHICPDFENIDQLRDYVFGNGTAVRRRTVSQIVFGFFSPTRTESIRDEVSQFFTRAKSVPSFLYSLSSHYIKYTAQSWHEQLLEHSIALRNTIEAYETHQNTDVVARKLLAALLIVEIDLINNWRWLYSPESFHGRIVEINQSHAEALFELYTQRCRELMLVIKTCDLYQEKSRSSNGAASSQTPAPTPMKLEITSIAEIEQVPHAQKQIALEALHEAQGWWSQISGEFEQIKRQLVERKAAKDITIYTKLPYSMMQKSCRVTLLERLLVGLEDADADKPDATQAQSSNSTLTL